MKQYITTKNIVYAIVALVAIVLIIKGNDLQYVGGAILLIFGIYEKWKASKEEKLKVEAVEKSETLERQVVALERKLKR